MKYIQASHVSTRDIDDEALLLPARLDVETQLQVHALNDTAKFLWAQLSTAQDKDELCSAMLLAYDVDEAVAAADIKTFIEGMLKKQLIAKT